MFDYKNAEYEEILRVRKTVGDVYIYPITLPPGYVVVDFRPPTPEEIWLGTNSSLLGHNSLLGPNSTPNSACGTLARLILKKQKRVTFIHTGEGRVPKAGEWFYEDAKTKYPACPMPYYQRAYSDMCSQKFEIVLYTEE